MLNICSVLLITIASAFLASASPTADVAQCGSNPSEEEVVAAETDFAQNRVYASKAANREDVVDINVYFNIVVHTDDDQTGSPSADTVNSQMDALNNAYRPAGISFNLQQIFRAVNSSWFNDAGLSTYHRTINLEADMKRALHEGGAGYLNIYTVGFTDPVLTGKLLGYATFPNKFANNPVSNDGLVVRYNTLPGIGPGPYNRGMTLVHEVGYWLGLYWHVFHGMDCGGPGDRVDDTPPQFSSTKGCTANKDTCAGGGPDSIHNYMNYFDDSCMNSITQGQINCVLDQIATYRNLRNQ